MPHSRSRSRPDAGDESPERPSSGTYWNESDRALSSDGTESYGPSEGFGMSEAITRALFCDVVLDGPDDQGELF